MYKFIELIIKTIVCKVIFRVKYKNMEIINKFDKCFICPNHSRVFDAIFIYSKFTNIYSVAKAEIFKNKLLCKFLKHYHVIPINRKYTDFKGTKKIINVLNSNDKIKLLLFPEGGIYKENYIENKRNVKNGAVYMSALINIPIIPVNITVRPRFFTKVEVTFLEPIYPNLEVLNNKKLLKEESKKLINTIYDKKAKADIS